MRRHVLQIAEKNDEKIINNPKRAVHHLIFMSREKLLELRVNLPI